ncbi:MAG TPA: ComEC/Rec2 family competence protein [Pyrinomonadaceae bacterium]|nr:ComEC/Rec2 family competence protein [Pyrinomonadaceae bacterium]
MNSRALQGCGCAAALLLAVAAAVFALYWFVFRDRGPKPPPPSGGELRVHVLDVGQGDSILIVSPEGKAALVDAGNPGNGKKIVEAMSRLGVSQLSLLVATHAHADHIGAADEVMRAVRVENVLDSGVPNATKNYEDFLKAIDETGAKLITAAPGQTYDLGGGARLVVLAPIPPFFTREQLRSGGNEPNANSVVTRLEYGQFSMLLTGDAEAQTEQRMTQTGAQLSAKVLKVGHHGSKYATSEDFLREHKFETAVISASANNLYGHPSQEVLDRLRAANIKVYRTDFQGTLTITTRGDEEYKIETERAPKQNEDMTAGREAKRDDSSRSGFVAYPDTGPPPRTRPSPQANSNRRAAGR